MKYSLVFAALLGLASCNSDTLNTGNLTGVWRAFSISGISDPVLEPTENKIAFMEDHSVLVNLDINTCGGTFTEDVDEVNITGNNCTEACCDSPFNSQIMPALNDVSDVSFVGQDTAILSSENGQVIIKLVRI